MSNNFTDQSAAERNNTNSTTSEAQLNANRANAQHSTGATSEAGRAASSQNRTTHGLTRHNGAFRLLPTEDENGFEALRAALAAEHQPATETERILVNSMAESHWLANRAQRLIDDSCDAQTGHSLFHSQFSLYLRYQTTHTRNFSKCLSELTKLKAARRKEQIGFEAQKIKKETHEIKKDMHAQANLRKDSDLRTDIAQLAEASRNRAPEYESLKAAFAAKWGCAPEESQQPAA